jgi:nitroreductase
MVRAFAPDPVDPAVVDGLLDAARRAPSAGNTQSVEFLVLEGPGQTEQYWDTTMSTSRRGEFVWPELLDAPVLVVVWVDPSAYVTRYQETDKIGTGLGDSEAAWPVPYWWVDGGAAVMSLLHGAVDRGLGASFFGLFGHEAAVRERFDVPVRFRAVGVVALGRAKPDRPSRSAGRARPPLHEVLHRGRWSEA